MLKPDIEKKKFNLYLYKINIGKIFIAITSKRYKPNKGLRIKRFYICWDGEK